jgi:hypothetical protein
LLCPAIIDAGQRAIRALGSRFAGIDLVTRDPARPLEETGGVFIEVNGTPNLYYHYNKSDGVYPAAAEVLRRVLDGTPPSMEPTAPQTAATKRLAAAERTSPQWAALTPN